MRYVFTWVVAICYFVMFLNDWLKCIKSAYCFIETDFLFFIPVLFIFTIEHHYITRLKEAQK